MVNNLLVSVEKADVYGFLGRNAVGKATINCMLLTFVALTIGFIL